MDWIPAKTILSGYRENSNWFGVNYNMNIYRGCTHGCIYCDSRSDCYGVENFDQVRGKEHALLKLEQELKSKRRKGVVGTGAMSDPYNPYERQYELTRGSLQLIDRFGFGVSIATKSDLVVRDVDILKKISTHSPVLVKITVTAADDRLSKKIEPHVAPSSQRLKSLKILSGEGIFAGVLMMPILPFIEDTEDNIQGIIELAHQSGAKFIFPAFGVTLRQNQREWFYEQLDLLFPGMKEQYVRTFGNSYECRSPRAKELWNLFEEHSNRYGILYQMEDIISAYKGSASADQLSFL